VGFSFFNWLASLCALVLGGRSNPERARKRGLKRIANAIAANAYGKFFRVKSAEATLDMAQFFYGIYRVAAPAQELLRNTAGTARLKLWVIAAFLEQPQRDMLAGLSAESMAKRAEETDPALLSREAQREFADFERSFDAGRTNAINELYRHIVMICEFVSYDYYGLLKKFNFNLTEHSFGAMPVFNFLRGEAVAEELKDFLEVAGGLEPSQDWSAPLRVLWKMKGLEAIKPEAWSAMLFETRELVNSKIFELIIRFVEKDPDWSWEPPYEEHENIVAAYLEMVRDEVFSRLALVVTARRNALLDRLAGAVFGNPRAIRLAYYTEERSEIFTKRKLPGFTEARALNCLMVFLSDERPEIQSLYELILIRGYWTSMELSFPLSEALWLLSGFPERITKLDEALADWGVYGSKLRTVMMNDDRNEIKTRSLALSMERTNGRAREIVNDAIFNLSILHEGLKDLLEDCRKNPGLIIRNWEELRYFSETSLESRIAGMWNKLTNMLELLRALSQDTENGQ
jgi:hypothetical protein